MTVERVGHICYTTLYPLAKVICARVLVLVAVTTFAHQLCLFSPTENKITIVGELTMGIVREDTEMKEQHAMACVEGEGLSRCKKIRSQ